MTMNNILTSDGLNIISFLTTRIFRKCLTWKFVYKSANFEPFECIELLFVPSQVVYKYCDNSFINKLASLNFVPQLIQKIYRAGTTWFYRFANAIEAQTHISLMTRPKICDRWLLMVLYLSCSQGKKTCGCKWRKDCDACRRTF